VRRAEWLAACGISNGIFVKEGFALHFFGPRANC
jgi:hypothetical protein